MSIRNNSKHTFYASYAGYFVQAIINNFIPLLFLTFQRCYGIPLGRMAVLVSVNFVVQLAVDLLAARYVDRIGYQMQKILGVPDEYELICFLPVGIPAEEAKPVKKQPFDERAWLNGFEKSF